MIYVLAAHPEPCTNLPFPRLYAFPRKNAVPPPESFVILDSGAYALHQQGRTMDERYMRLLARYYAARVGPNVLAIAPDEFLNPAQSQRNFTAWHRAGNPPIVPVLQFRQFKRLDLFTLMKQAAWYWRYADHLPRWQGKPVLAISNPGLKARECRTLAYAIRDIRRTLGDVWLHNLGAGWSPQDIRDWAELDCFDSIDSIAYYTDAQHGLWWPPGGTARHDERDWRELARLNAITAQASARR